MLDQDLSADLERFVLDNPELERLESILGDFNPFTALRWTRQEVRHSQFLRWLLDPQETHGLGDYFTRTFLKHVAAKARGQEHAPSVIDADGWDYGNTQVQCEWNNVDVFLRNDDLRLAVVLENKVDSQEHSEQLQRYRMLVEGRFPDYSRLFVFLTVGGDAPSDDGYLSVDYSEVADLVAMVAERRADQLGPEVRTFMLQYVEMLRRHIVQDSEIQELCQTIYQTHRRALDAIFEYRPDRTLELSTFLQGIIEGRDSLILDGCSKAYVRFTHAHLNHLPRGGSGWTRTGRILLFEIDLSAGDVRLKGAVGPGPQQHREAIRACIRESPTTFNRANSKMYPQWWTFHSERWLTKARFETLDDVGDLLGSIGDRLSRFVDQELPPMVEALAPLAHIDWSGLE